MALRLIKSKSAQTDAEEFFLAHYERVLEWARHLTNHDYVQAEDLTHDLFVQLSLNPPAFDRIENLENYLFIVLKNLHRFQRKKEARFPNQISITDYDSAETGWQTLVNFDNQLQIWQELEIACGYACRRKETSRTGSVFILRFFHGYFPSEIARILCGSRSSVGELLRVARSEVRAVLETPNKIAFLKNNQTKANLNSSEHKPEAMIDALREQIFATRTGECLPEKTLRDFYEIGSAELIDRARLAHFAACAKCLEKINKILDLTELSNRFPPDNLGPEIVDAKRKKLAKVADKRKSLDKFRRKLQSVREHEPRELWVAVNGFVLGSQSVKTAFNEQTLGLEPLENIKFIDVYSEQNVRLCALTVEQPPAGDFEQTANISLSNARNLEINLNFCGNWRNVKVIYADAALEESASQIAPIKLSDERQSKKGFAEEIPNFWQKIRNFIYEKFAPFFNREFWTRPTVWTFLIAVPLIALLIFWRVSLDEIVLPDSRQIIEKAAAAEKSFAPDNKQSTRRTIEIEERRGGATTARYLMEIWRRDGSVKENFYTTAKRIFGENGKIIAGEWQKADGTRHRKSVEKSALDETIWRDSAIENLNQAAEQIEVSDAGDFYVLDNKNLSLTVRKADFRVTGQTLRNENGGREFRFVETAFERREAGETPAEIFNPNSIQPEIPLVLIKSPETESPQPKTESLPQTANTTANFAATKPTNKPLATAETEVEALNLLSAAKGDLNEQISVKRESNGVLRIAGVVETAERKAEILRALSPIATNPAVEIKIQTVAEVVAEQAKKKSLKQTEITLEQKDADGFSIPAEDDLRSFFASRGVSDVDGEIRRFSQAMFSRSRRAAQHAGALRQIAQRFSQAEIENLTPKAKVDFLVLVKKHARNLQSETNALRSELAPVFGGNAGGGASGKINLNDIKEVQSAAERLVSLTNEIDRQIRAAFSASANKRAAQVLRTQNFQTNLQHVESLAAALADN